MSKSSKKSSMQSITAMKTNTSSKNVSAGAKKRPPPMKEKSATTQKSTQLPQSSFEQSANPTLINTTVVIVGGIGVLLVALAVTLYITNQNTRTSICKKFIEKMARDMFTNVEQGGSTNISMFGAQITGLSVKLKEINKIWTHWNNTGNMYFSLFYPIVHFNTSVNASGLGIKSKWLLGHSHNVSFDFVLTITSDEKQFDLLSGKMFARIDHPKPDASDSEDKVDPETQQLFGELLKDSKALLQLQIFLENNIFKIIVKKRKPSDYPDLSCFRVL